MTFSSCANSRSMILASSSRADRRAPPKNEAEHFMCCPVCSGQVDMRDLTQIFDHEGRCRIRQRIANNRQGAGAVAEAARSAF
jgi:hypothetical protein